MGIFDLCLIIYCLGVWNRGIVLFVFGTIVLSHENSGISNCVYTFIYFDCREGYGSKPLEP